MPKRICNCGVCPRCKRCEAKRRARAKYKAENGTAERAHLPSETEPFWRMDLAREAIKNPLTNPPWERRYG